jgi:hypothetical protein
MFFVVLGPNRGPQAQEGSPDARLGRPEGDALDLTYFASGIPEQAGHDQGSSLLFGEAADCSAQGCGIVTQARHLVG